MFFAANRGRMKRCARLIASVILVVLTVHLTVGMTFSRCAHSGKLSFGLSHEVESEGNGFHCGCMEVFTEVLPEYAPSDGPDGTPPPAVLSFFRLPEHPLSVLAFPRRVLPDGSPGIRLLSTVLLRR